VETEIDRLFPIGKVGDEVGARNTGEELVGGGWVGVVGSGGGELVEEVSNGVVALLEVGRPDDPDA
jgi:hypothetical protein